MHTTQNFFGLCLWQQYTLMLLHQVLRASKILNNKSMSAFSDMFLLTEGWWTDIEVLIFSSYLIKETDMQLFYSKVKIP